MNVFLLGLAFMFVFTGFNTMSGIQVGQAMRVKKKMILMMGEDDLNNVRK